SGRYPAALVRDYGDSTRRLAELAVGFGANVQPGQIVGVNSNTGKEELTRAVARAAYERGARWVDVLYYDPWVKRERIALAPEDSLDEVPPWMVDRLEWLSEQRGRAGCARRARRAARARRARPGSGRPRPDPVPAQLRPGREPAHHELVHGPGADGRLGEAGLPRHGRGPGIRAAVGRRCPRLPPRRG